jgi:hypothetical protein
LLSCVDRFGLLAQFDVECRAFPGEASAGPSWEFKVRPAGAPSAHDYFLLVVELVSSRAGRIVAMAHHYDPDLRAKGIPDALIPAAGSVTGLTIQSSPTRSDVPNVYRTADATKVWRRLLARGAAVYDAEADIFSLVPGEPGRAQW